MNHSKVFITVTSCRDMIPRRTTLAQFLRDNQGDEEVAALVPQILSGSEVSIGGGSGPLYRIRREAQ